MIDTHAHLYDEAFDDDRHELMLRAKEAGVSKIILPNVDSESLPCMLQLEKDYPGFCFAAIGLHPTSVKGNYAQELALVKSELERRKYIAIGEIGIDLYWDKTFLREQIKSFRQQAEWALTYDLPIIIHMRDSFRETMDALSPYEGSGLKGIFHSFTGTPNEVDEVLEFGGFFIGFNGIITFKNAKLDDSVRRAGLENIVIETDSPYLSPTPYRGKRNESAYLLQVMKKVAEIFGITNEEADRITTKNAEQVYKMV